MQDPVSIFMQGKIPAFIPVLETVHVSRHRFQDQPLFGTVKVSKIKITAAIGFPDLNRVLAEEFETL
jgi:hypothetical protein